MKRVKIVVGTTTGLNPEPIPDDVVELDDKIAAQLIRVGHAVPVDKLDERDGTKAEQPEAPAGIVAPPPPGKNK